MNRPLSSDKDLVDESHGNVRFPLLLLLEAHELARDLKQSEWEFALQLPSLHARKVSDSQIRWLICQKWVEHRMERASSAKGARSFLSAATLRFSAESCFALTHEGVAAAMRFVKVEREGNTKTTVDSSARHERRPFYDAALRTLFFDKVVVKQFRVPAANQELVLLAFQEENWPPRLHDPIPCKQEVDTKRRLGDTIKQLNARQKTRRILFRGDGTGCGIVWEEFPQIYRRGP